jgi:hypothetical protein
MSSAINSSDVECDYVCVRSDPTDAPRAKLVCYSSHPHHLTLVSLGPKYSKGPLHQPLTPRYLLFTTVSP